jgi:methyltransferase
MTWPLGTQLYLALVLVVGAQRLLELKVARENARRARSAGAIEVGSEHYPWMVALHTAFLVAGPLEVVLLERPLHPPLALAMLLLLVASAMLRYWVMRTLGDRWTTRVFVFPGRLAVRSGPYRYLRHPNYLAVGIEIVALPMVHTAWLTAALFTLLNALVLRQRIRVEEEALRRYSSYDQVFER